MDRDRLPVCSDPDDQKFLELALACGAAYLVTKDRALLELARRSDRALPFRIVTPGELERSLAATCANRRGPSRFEFRPLPRRRRSTLRATPGVR